MADFSTGLSEVQGAGVSAPPAEIDPTAVGVVKGLEAVTDIFLENKEKEVELTANKLKNTVISSFTNQQLKLADAVEAGQMSPVKARMLMRSSVQQAITAHPELASDILGIQSKLTSTPGLAKSAAEQAQDLDDMKEEATDAGWVLPSMTNSEKEIKTREYFAWKKTGEEIKREQELVALENAKLATQSARLGISKSELDLQKTIRVETSKGHIRKLADAYIPKFRMDTEKVLAAFRRGEMDQQEAITAIRGQFSSIESIVNSVGIDAGRDYITTVVSPMERIKNSTEELLSGKLDQDTYESQVKSLVAQAKLNVLKQADDEYLNWMAVSQLSPNVPAEFVVGFTKVTTDLMAKMSNPEGQNGNVFDQDGQGVRTYYNSLKGVMSKSDKLGDGVKDEVVTHLSNTLSSIPEYAGSVKSVKQLLPTLDYLSSPEVGKWMAEKGGVPKENVEAARNAMMSLYEGKVLPLIQKEFSRHSVSFDVRLGEEAPEGEDVKRKLGKGFLAPLNITQPASSLVEPVFTGTGMSFKPIEGLTDSQARVAKGRAQELNKNVTPVVNKFIRMAAHLDGSLDYRKAFEENFVNLFAPQPEAVEE